MPPQRPRPWRSVDRPADGAARRTIRLTRLEAIPFAVMTGLTDPFMIPYVLALGGTAFQAGILSSLRTLMLSLSQLHAVEALHAVGSRKRMVLWTVGLQAVLWIPIAAAAPAFGTAAVPGVIGLFMIGSAAASLGGPAWGSLVSEQLPARRRGEFFGRREMIVGLTTAGAGLAGGALLQVLTREGGLRGFMLLFGGAALCRLASWWLLSRLDDRPWVEPPEARVTFTAFLAQARTDNFVRFALCMGCFSFAVNLSVPYLTVYMLEELQYGYFTYSVVVFSGTMIGNLAIPRWGRIGDARGNMAVLRLTMVGASVLPFLWPLFPQPAWLLAMHVVGGILWGGLNLSSVNFVYDASRPDARARYLAYFNVANGCGVSLGALAGAALLGVLPEIGDRSVLVVLFFLSGSARCLATALFQSVVREVRPVHQIGLREVMYDLVGQRVVQVLGYFSVTPERERQEPQP